MSSIWGTNNFSFTNCVISKKSSRTSPDVFNERSGVDPTMSSPKVVGQRKRV
jgi:hypothetical protein